MTDSAKPAPATTSALEGHLQIDRKVVRSYGDKGQTATEYHPHTFCKTDDAPEVIRLLNQLHGGSRGKSLTSYVISENPLGVISSAGDIKTSMTIEAHRAELKGLPAKARALMERSLGFPVPASDAPDAEILAYAKAVAATVEEADEETAEELEEALEA